MMSGAYASEVEPAGGYHGSLTELHGVWVEVGHCDCAVCRVVWESYLTDPDGHGYCPEVRWRLVSGERGLTLRHVRSESFRRVAIGGVA